MITNLLVTITVTLSTNVSERFPKMLISDPPPMASSGAVEAIFLGHYINVPNPKEKWVVTDISSNVTFSFNFNGQNRGWTEESPSFTNWSVHYDKREDWVISQTNIPPTPEIWSIRSNFNGTVEMFP